MLVRGLWLGLLLVLLCLLRRELIGMLLLLCRLWILDSVAGLTIGLDMSCWSRASG